MNYIQYCETGSKIDEILSRATKVYDNYPDAVDFNMSPFWYKIRRKLNKGISNCTLTVSLWIDPNNPIKSATSIIDDRSLGYEQIDRDLAQPGDLMITMNPQRGTYHTMLIESIDLYGEPVLRYSAGGHDLGSFRSGVTREDYHKRDNKQGGGHTYEMFYRYTR